MTKLLYENDLIFLEPFTEKFIEKGSPYLEWFHDADVTRFNSHGLFPYGKKAMEEFLNTLYDGSKTVFAIMAKIRMQKEVGVTDYIGRSIHIGNCSLQGIDWVNRSAEFAIVIGDKNYWCRGIGTMCLEFMLEHGFDKLNLWRIWTGTTEPNKAMAKMAVSCGMVYEGTFRQASFLYGKYHDVFEFGILLPEWEEKVKNYIDSSQTE